ncbi:DNA polymerase III subunit chi [Acidocella sp.]|uniref:DNA polymerase III subunit chi n=1 Tax=Acidocella sp. TaxID=50710 RepID=UPI00261EB020|nr:DNA polymerase III subunit chi [Acidocella sp.]
MSQIGFYHLTRSDLFAALPALLGRTLAAKETALVVCPDEATLRVMDERLWTCASPDWLPHGTAATPHPEWQPVFLTLIAEENPAKARFLFCVNGAGADAASGFARVFDLFDGNDPDAVAAARGRWKAAKEAGYELAYWKQEESGWVKAG